MGVGLIHKKGVFAAVLGCNGNRLGKQVGDVLNKGEERVEVALSANVGWGEVEL